MSVKLGRRENGLGKGEDLAEGSTEGLPSHDCKNRQAEKQCLLGPCCEQAPGRQQAQDLVLALQIQELSSEVCQSWPSLCLSAGIH